MLRFTRRLAVMEGAMYAPMGVACLPVIAQDIDQNDFHSKCMPLLYTSTTETAAFSKVHNLYNRRLIVRAPVTVEGKCLFIPMLVDTGAPQTYLHHFALGKFLGKAALVDSYSIKVGVTPIQATAHDTQTGVVAHMNILGMDFLNEGIPTLIPFMSEAFVNLSARDQPISEVWVTDGKASFPVKPEGMKVAHLKKAIKEYRMYALPPFALTIKNPEGVVLGDEDDLLPGTKYTYALPKWERSTRMRFPWWGF
jgi:hypothetical protein